MLKDFENRQKSKVAGVMHDSGKILVGKYRKNIIPLLLPSDEKSSNSFYVAYQSLMLKKNFESDLGDVHFQLTEYEKVTLITIPLNIRKNRYFAFLWIQSHNTTNGYQRYLAKFCN